LHIVPKSWYVEEVKMANSMLQYESFTAFPFPFLAKPHPCLFILLMT